MLIAFFRTVILYLLIVIGIRLMGKRQVGELEPAELVLAMLLSDLAAVPMQDFGIPLIYGLIPIVTLLALTMLLSVLTLKSLRFRRLLCGRPSIVVRQGVILQQELSRTRMTPEELMEELRLQGISDLRQVNYAILETSGQLSVLLRARAQPVTPADLGQEPEEAGLPLTIINQGLVFTDNLSRRGLDQRWLARELSSRGFRSPREVFFMTVDEAGNVCCMAKEEGK
ncbi:MAG: DUF421 domain-containing protein [Oscillospiraceae bacterium]|nr:DUF421 domain-containing protein [Oscillospiraceae bacterium]